MSDQTPPDPTPESEHDTGGEPPELTDAERELLEQQMREIRVEDLLAQTVASVLNLSARRIVKEDEVDLEQARIGIEAVRAIVDLLPAEVEAAIREPLSQIQLLYAQRSGGQAPGGPPAGDSPADGPGGGSGPAKGSPGGSGLWTPGS